MTTPGYWMNEITGVLRPAVMAYLNGEPMSADQIGAMRAYLRQWMAGAYAGQEIEDLRQRIDSITDLKSLSDWMCDAIDAGIDPL